MDPVALYAIVDDVLQAVKARIDATLPERFRFENVAVVNGPAVLDGLETCTPHLVAWAEVIQPSDNFPAPPARAILCTPPAAALQVVVQTLRCEPVLDERGFPAPAERDAAARLTYVDGQIAWNAVIAWAMASEYDVLMVGGSPVPPSIVSGWETRFQVEVEACGPAGPDKEFPDGYLEAIDAAGL